MSQVDEKEEKRDCSLLSSTLGFPEILWATMSLVDVSEQKEECIQCVNVLNVECRKKGEVCSNFLPTTTNTYWVCDNPEPRSLVDSSEQKEECIQCVNVLNVEYRKKGEVS